MAHQQHWIINLMGRFQSFDTSDVFSGGPTMFRQKSVQNDRYFKIRSDKMCGTIFPCLTEIY